MDLAALSRRVELDASLPERRAHARDLWPRGTLALALGEEAPPPRAVAFPRSAEEVATCLEWAAAEGVPVVPWGAGSGVCGAAAGRADALALDLKRLDGLGPVEDGAVTVGAGLLGQHLEDALAARGWATRHSPSSIWCSTVGGWAASRSAGQFSSRYGKFEDMVLGARVVAPAGAFGTGVWAGGEDLQPWLLGTEGALGVLTELRVRVVPLPRHRWLRGYRFADPAAALDAMRRVMQADLRPAALRLYDPVDTRIAGKGTATRHEGDRRWLAGLGERVRATPGLGRHLLDLPLALPRLVNALARAASGAAVLIAGWEGEDRDAVWADAGRGDTILREHGEDLGAEPGEHWYAHRHEVSYKMAAIFAMGGFADTMEVAAPWSRLGALYDAVRAALGRHALVMAHFSHAYREGCSIYFTFAGRGDLATYDAAWADALAAAEAVGGTVAHHHGVGQLKMAAAARELAGVGPLFHALKARLDPAGILNPGRLFPDVAAPEPAAPAVGVDEVSRTATLDAQAAAATRDRWLADRGWRLRFPTPGPLASAVHTPAPHPTETPVLGVSARTPAGRVVVRPVPRSAAGPDVRTVFPPDAYETITVPVDPLEAPR